MIQIYLCKILFQKIKFMDYFLIVQWFQIRATKTVLEAIQAIIKIRIMIL